MPLQEPVDHPVKAGVGVSTRNFRKAVHRNRIKRLLRECYRLNKTLLPINEAVNQKPVAVFFLYVGKEMPAFLWLNEKMQLVLTKLQSAIA